jgi:hypothetical protein
MGTSVNHPSPKTPNWDLAKAMLGHENVPLERQNEELWKAALADPVASLPSELGSALLAQACELAGKSTSPSDAIKSFDEVVLSKHTASLTLDMGRRALARTVANNAGSTGFAMELFSEAVSYYAARDLPSYIGAQGRISSPGDAINLKEKLRAITQDTVKKVGQVKTDISGWKTYVDNVLNALQRRTK